MTVTGLAPALRALSPAGLDELTDRAALLTRVDRKYVLPLADVHRLLAELGDRRSHRAARVLEIDGARAFGYASVYFDTPDLLSYRLAAHRRPVRWKIRTRTYVDSQQCWLEVKTRDRRGRTVKHRRAHDPAASTRLTEDGALFADAVLGELGMQDAQQLTSRLAPTLVTHYNRSTLLLLDDDTRVTLDTDLVCTDSAGADGAGPSGAAQGGTTERRPESRSLRLAGRAVVETKTLGRPSVADRALWSLGHRPVAVSKFATGLAALHPDLPATRWRPVLRRHFPVQPDTGHSHHHLWSTS
ncbi:polyphosphate polymerase domain-containing protein [Cellulomonas sp. ATA003]|uniref:polyphosphate polymerase domain-containing protein n=1 Tax=Cellulomonas sp. ATA003 TaxID=3073064 RepID=UPI00287356FF|nr:polyphosphate polymerase domain-containing protein [Cellulomonas sp. ATA003]WNB85623.1 polyphosphate polymerase domain-containing protein [Cellulomonas sp. ATA003]